MAQLMTKEKYMTLFKAMAEDVEPLVFFNKIKKLDNELAKDHEGFSFAAAIIKHGGLEDKELTNENMAVALYKLGII